jgi:hypothetical protein
LGFNEGVKSVVSAIWGKRQKKPRVGKKKSAGSPASENAICHWSQHLKAKALQDGLRAVELKDGRPAELFVILSRMSKTRKQVVAYSRLGK